MYPIVRREQLSDATFLWELHAPDVARAAQPGHFVMLRLADGGERIPLTVADFDREWGTITMVIQALGKTTRDMMTNYRQGDSILDFVGPLGVASHIADVGHVLLVGGGLGVAPVFPQLRAFKQAGNRTTGIIGFRSKELVFWEDRFREHCDQLMVCTDDGSYGRAGFVTAALDEVLRTDKPDLVVAIGPLPMMHACTKVTRHHGVRTMVSLNSIMVDGTGMCGSCRVTLDGQVQFACVDGPDFDAHKVDFDELIVRARRFKEQEAHANRDFDHVCHVEKQLFEENKRNYKKLKELPLQAVKMAERPADERSRNFLEVNLGYSMSDALVEAERCIQCLNPTCIAGCPVNIDIPRFIRHLLVRDMPGALSVIHDTNLFPSICGRVCPQETQCEIQCILAKKMEPVAIGRLERFVGDHAPLAETKPPANAGQLGKVAVVGSGPAGLACAGDLAKAGASVTVYEALHVVGGVLKYGIPSFRLPRETIDREVQRLTDLGVRMERNKVIGKTFTIPQLLGEMGYDAVFVGTGAGFPTFLGIPGEHAGQVYSANEFLTRVNLMGGDKFPFQDTPVTIGKKVVVLGAGNTAMDCLRVSRRLGAEEVHCVYRRTEAEAPARIEEIRHAKEEGIHFHWLMAPIEIDVDESGGVKALVTQKMTLGEPDASGRRRPVALEGQTETFECDTVIYALGTRANPVIARTTPGLSTRNEGYINVDETTQAANIPGLFAGGDIVTGGATVILALGAGRRAAKAIQQYLKTREWPPKLEPESAKARGKKKPAAEAPAVVEHVCPRCHEPIEEGEEYVCCAGQKLTWSCTACQKVYEGFAFPYGLCPSCGGALERGHDVKVEGEAALEAIRHAFEIELGGQVFYERGAHETNDPDVRDLFVRLVAMEREHAVTLARRYHVPVPSPDAPGISPDQVATYAGTKLETGDALELLRLAIRLEKRARTFFAGRGQSFAPASPEWRLYRELAAEEKEHEEILETALVRLKAGRPLLV